MATLDVSLYSYYKEENFYNSDTGVTYAFGGITSPGTGGTTIYNDGSVNISGTPVDNQIAIWTDENTIEGSTNLMWDGDLSVIGDTSITGYLGINTTPTSEYDLNIDGVGSVASFWINSAVNPGYFVRTPSPISSSPYASQVNKLDIGTDNRLTTGPFTYYRFENLDGDKNIGAIGFIPDGSISSGKFQVYTYKENSRELQLELSKEGNLQIAGTINVKGNTYLNDDVSIGDDLYVLDNTYMYDNAYMYSSAYITNEVSLGSNLTVQGNANIHGYITDPTTTYVSGFAGAGYKIYEDPTGIYRAAFDHLTVRRSMKVYEMIINQVRASRGSIWVSDVADVSTVQSSVAHDYLIVLDTDDGNLPNPFEDDDLLLCQKWNGRDIRYYALQVYNSSTGQFDAVRLDGSDDPSTGDVLVRIGNATDSDRQGALYLTASDDNAPYIDILDEVDTYSLANKTKARLGKLTGITDASFGGALSGHGLYSNNAYLKGNLYATDGVFNGTVYANDGVFNGSIIAGDGSIANWSIKDGMLEYKYEGSSVVRVIADQAGIPTGFQLYRADGDINTGDAKLVQAGNLYQMGNSMTPSHEYGFQVKKRVSGGYDDLIWIGDSSALIAGWNFDEESIYTGTKKITDGYSTNGITLAGNGGIHAPDFYINSDGSVAARNITLETREDGTYNRKLRIEDYNIYETGVAANSTLQINYKGYGGGSSYYRDTHIGNGRNVNILECDGGTETLGGEINAKTQINFYGRHIYPASSHSSSLTLGEDDPMCICTNTSSITVTLPHVANDGETYFVKRGNTGAVTVAASSIRNMAGFDVSTISMGTQDGIQFIWNGTLDTWLLLGMTN